MSEAQLQAAVLEVCERLKLLTYHVTDSRRALARGFPDLVIAGPRGVIFRELKSEDGETSPDQDMWIWMLCKAGASCEIWRPADWHSGRIRAALEALS